MNPTIEEAVEKRNNGEKMEVIGKAWGISKSQAQRRIVDAGYTYNKTTKKYEVSANEEQPDADAPTEESKSKSKVKAKSNAPKHASASKEKASATESTGMQLDIFDMLLQAQASKSKKVSRSFYIDADVLPILDSVKGGNKSELVNEALRKVFREKGLL